MHKDLYRLPSITLLAVLLEVTIIIIVSITATSQFLDPNPNVKLHGYEGEWLTSSARFASHSLQRYGYIPLWQPYLSRGEPLIDNAFSFVLNPISAGPTLLYGGNIGIRYSIVLTAILAGLGGWALGRVMGFGSVGRVLLGLLMAGKGNMIAMIGQGYFQLGSSQAYIPWVIAGTIGILRLNYRRFPIIMTAVMLTLMFWAGNIYFLLPTLMSVAGLTLTHIFSIRREETHFAVQLDSSALGRMLLAAVFTLGLCAITFLPIFAHQGYIGGHPNEQGAGTYADLGRVLRMFFDGSRAVYDQGLAPGKEEFYHSFVLPLWFGAVMFVLLPPIGRLLYRPSMPQAWKVWMVGILMIVFCTLWGSGQNPVVEWMYKNLPLIGQWRFVGRMLGIVSFWIAAIAVLRVDALWRAVVLERSWQHFGLLRHAQVLQPTLALCIAGVSWVAGAQVTAQWKDYAGTQRYGEFYEDECIDWLRREYPDRYLSVWTLDYAEIEAYLRHNVRHDHIAANFYVLGVSSTLFDSDLTHMLPEFAIPWSEEQRSYLREHGYVERYDSPAPYESYNHCIWQKPDTFSYAFMIPRSDLEDQFQTLPVELTIPISNFVHYPDQIALGVQASPEDDLVVIVQEVAYPGWKVEVDGKSTRLESVGGLIGVVIPAGNRRHLVYYAYRPPLFYLGAVITLFTWVVCVASLLYADRLLPKSWRSRGMAWISYAGKQAYDILTSPELFEPRLPDATQQGGRAHEAEPEAEGETVEETG